jgi:transcriptional regulator with XRE-family HTH domain
METTIGPPEWRAANPSELGAALTRLRRNLGLSQEQMAARIGVYRPYLSKLETGIATEQLNRIFAILHEAEYEFVIAPKAGKHAG